MVSKAVVNHRPCGERKFGVDEREVHCYWNKTGFPLKRVTSSHLNTFSIVNSKLFCYSFIFHEKKPKRSQKRYSRRPVQRGGFVKLKLLCATEYQY